ncbi:putative oxidoreductase OrdL [Lachnellula cervina]|uniref:Putative oxidoreductase OrdL n=1 Tax=Lachnellula cervina TaxID=1316786 RepID=A0A7D8USD7_9HELO|nr:putative oxidoreductase OrdL [Lachnellula cervina]
MIASNEDLKRGVKPSGPIANPCLSYWQRTTRAFSHLNANRNEDVPNECLYVIIGSGISGALTAFELTESGVDGKDVIILEAREAASGASGRNAGHVRPDAFRGFKHYSTFHGPEQALKIIANERLVLEKVDEFVRKHDIQCDFNLTTTFDVCMTPEFAAYEAENFEAFRKAGGDVSHVKYYDTEEAQKRTGVNNAVAAYEWPAGSSHPAKLAQWLLDAAIERGVTLFTHCSVPKVTKHDNGKSWNVHTPRGNVTTCNVIHCTNAYAALLLPQLERHLTPNRAQAHSLIAPPAFSGPNTLGSTFSLRYGLHHFYSLIQRKNDGTMIFGVSRGSPNLSPETLRGCVTFEDRDYNEEILNEALRQWQILFPGKDQDIAGRNVHGEGLDHAWTGIIGMTADSVPFVGPVEGMDGQWVCAGFGGHGMARIFTCAPGIVKLMLGKEWSETGLPECFNMNKERALKLGSK